MEISRSGEDVEGRVGKLIMRMISRKNQSFCAYQICLHHKKKLKHQNDSLNVLLK